MKRGSLTVTANDTNVILDTGARSASIVIDGGTIQAKGRRYSHGINLTAAELEINGGEIAALNSNSYAVVSQYGAPVTITGGTLAGNSTNTFYLNPVSDNTLGAMKTGWVQIDGAYYYFSDVPDRAIGRLLKNTTTPDGYPVDDKGMWHPEQKMGL